MTDEERVPLFLACYGRWLRQTVGLVRRWNVKPETKTWRNCAEAVKLCEGRGVGIEEYLLAASVQFNPIWVKRVFHTEYVPLPLIACEKTRGKVEKYFEPSVVCDRGSIVEKYVRMLGRFDKDTIPWLVENGFCGGDGSIKSAVLERIFPGGIFTPTPT